MTSSRSFAPLLAVIAALVSCLASASPAAPPSGKKGKSKLTLSVQLESARVQEESMTFGLVIRDTRDRDLPLTVELSSDPSSFVTFDRKVNDKGDVQGWFQRADGTWGIYFFNPFNTNPMEVVPEVVDVSINTPHFQFTNITNPPLNTPTKVIFYEGGPTHGFVYEYVRGDMGVKSPVNEQNSGPEGRWLSVQINDLGDIAADELVEIPGTGRGRKNRGPIVERLYRNLEGVETWTEVTPPLFDIQALNNHGTSWLTLYEPDGSQRQVLHNDVFQFIDLELLIAGSGAWVDFGLMNRDGPSVLGYTEIATLNVSATGGWELVILSPEVAAP